MHGSFKKSPEAEDYHWIQALERDTPLKKINMVEKLF
jgi:hypothetical protein